MYFHDLVWKGFYESSISRKCFIAIPSFASFDNLSDWGAHFVQTFGILPGTLVMTREGQINSSKITMLIVSMLCHIVSRRKAKEPKAICPG